MKPRPHPPLTRRQRAVLEGYSNGRNDKEQCAILGISARTIEFHWRCIMVRLKAKNRGQAILRWLRR